MSLLSALAHTVRRLRNLTPRTFVDRQNLVANFGGDRLEDHDWQRPGQPRRNNGGAALRQGEEDSAAGATAADTSRRGSEPPLSAPGKGVLRNLLWGNPGDIADAKPPFDLLLGSDLMYHSADLLALADTIADLTAPRCVRAPPLHAVSAWFPDPGRCTTL